MTLLLEDVFFVFAYSNLNVIVLGCLLLVYDVLTMRFLQRVQ